MAQKLLKFNSRGPLVYLNFSLLKREPSFRPFFFQAPPLLMECFNGEGGKDIEALRTSL